MDQWALTVAIAGVLFGVAVLGAGSFVRLRWGRSSAAREARLIVWSSVGVVVAMSAFLATTQGFKLLGPAFMLAAGTYLVLRPPNMAWGRYAGWLAIISAFIWLLPAIIWPQAR